MCRRKIKEVNLMKRILALVVLTLLLLTATSVLAAEAGGAVLKVGVGAQFTILDPALNTEVVNNYAIRHMYSGLFKADEDNNAIGELCESYEVSEDGRVYTFKLVDANWSDGVPLTAHDFVYSYLRALSYGADNAWASNDLVTMIQGAAEYNTRALEIGDSFDLNEEDASDVGVRALDDKTLELTLINPCVYFTKLLGSNVWLPVREDFAPQHESLWAFTGDYPVIGRYALVECNENEKCVLKKNPAYFRADEVIMDTIHYVVIPDEAAQALAYQSGEVDIALSVPGEMVLTYVGTENLWVMPRCSNYFIAINSGESGPEWAKDVNLRRALALTIDKDVLVEVLGGADLYPPLAGYVPTGVGGVSDDFRAERDAQGGYTLVYDLEMAKELLAEAGYGEGNPLQIHYKYSNNAMHPDVATMLQSMWQTAGFNVVFDAVESGVFYDQMDNGDFESGRYGYVASDDAMQYLELWTTQIQVVPAVDDATFDQMVTDARAIADPTAYYTALHAIEDYLCEENVYVIPLFEFTTPVLVQSNVSGYRSLGGAADFGQCVIVK